MAKPVVCIGIVAYDGLGGQVAQDYMRLMFHLGRRHQEYDFQLAIRWKSEQFRARNSIVKAALQFGATYLWMLDDDHIIDVDGNRGETTAYDLPIKLIKRLDETPNAGVVGALYFQRGGDFYPVIMQESKDDARPYFLTHQELSQRMQKVDVTGGGCMMIRMSIFDKLKEPWFAPEHEWGTDIQLCKQIRAAGYEVWCDTGLEIGHLQTEHRVVTQDLIKTETSHKEYRPLVLFRKDVQEYLGMSMEDIQTLAAFYDPRQLETFHGTLNEYYATRGNEQLARQMMYHHHPNVIKEMQLFHSTIRTDTKFYGCDYGCGSAPVSFHFALSGHKMDFVDIDGSGAYEFTKWRVKRRGVDAGFTLKGPYDYVMMLDSIEHIPNWEETLTKIILCLKEGGVLVTNYFYNRDYQNPEHVSMDQDAVRAFLKANGFTTDKELFWVKRAEQMEAA